MMIALKTIRFRGDSGQAVIEMALVLPLLLIIMAGATELSRGFYADYEVSNAARAGLQWAAVNYTSSASFTSMQTAATNDAKDLTGMTAVASRACQCDDGTSVSCTTGTCTTGNVRFYVTVVTSFPFNTIGTYPYIPRPMTFTTTAKMRVK